MATLRDYLGNISLGDAWPRWKANAIAINNQVIAHVAGTADKHAAQDITYTGDFTGKTEVKAALDQAKTEIDLIVVSASIDPEVAFARDSAVKSKVFGSLDARLEESEQDRVTDKAEDASEEINVMFPPAPLIGAKGDGITDDTIALQAIFDYAVANIKDVYFPKGNYLTINTLSLVGSRIVINATRMSKIIYRGDGIALLINGDANEIYKLVVEKEIQTWINGNEEYSEDMWLEQDAGIKVLNCSNGRFMDFDVNNFHTGFLGIGDGGGFAYNKIEPNYLGVNKFNIVITSGDIGTGWANENTINGGRLHYYSQTPQTGRYGIYIRDGKNGYSQNSNKIYNVNFELGAEKGSHAIVVEGTNTLQMGGRFEGNDYSIEFEKNAYSSYFIVNYIDAQIVDKSQTQANTVIGNYYRSEITSVGSHEDGRYYSPYSGYVYCGGFRGADFAAHDVDGALNIAPFYTVRSSTGILYQHYAGFYPTTVLDKDEINNCIDLKVVNVSIGMLLELERFSNPEFILDVVASDTNVGGYRYWVQCYDENMDPIPFTDNVNDVVGGIAATITKSSLYAPGNYYYIAPGTNLTSKKHKYRVRFKSYVKYAFVGVSNSTDIVKIEEFHVYNLAIEYPDMDYNSLYKSIHHDMDVISELNLSKRGKIKNLNFDSGTTAERPITPKVSQQYFDTTLSKPIWYSGANWVDATGTTA